MLNNKKIYQFVVISFGIVCLSSVFMKLTQIPYGSLTSILILACICMPAPAIAAFIVQKLIYHKPLKELGLRWTGTQWLWLFLLTPTLFLCFFYLSLALTYVMGNWLHSEAWGVLNYSYNHVADFILQSIKANGGDPAAAATKLNQLRSFPVDLPILLLLVGPLLSIIAGFTVNLASAFGEEFGWRGLMLSETRQLGFWNSNLLTGTIWGIWHAPLILMGHNYAHHPYFGMLMMIPFCISLSFIQSYLRIKTNSIWGPSVFHGCINAAAGLWLILIVTPNELIGSIAGLLGIVTNLIITLFIVIFDRDFIKNFIKCTL